MFASCRVPIYTPGWRAAMWIKCLAEGQNCQALTGIEHATLWSRVKGSIQYITEPPHGNNVVLQTNEWVCKVDTSSAMLIPILTPICCFFSNFKHSLWTPSLVCIPIVSALLTFGKNSVWEWEGDLRGTASLCAADLLVTNASLQWGQLFDTHQRRNKSPGGLNAHLNWRKLPLVHIGVCYQLEKLWRPSPWLLFT